MSEEKYKEQIDNLMNSFNNLVNTYNDVNSKLTKRIMKAIDYIKEHTNNGMFELRSDTGELEELLEILGDKENE